MSNEEEKVAGFLSSLLSNFVSDAVINPLIKPIASFLFGWVKDKQTHKALLEAARNAESDFRVQATEKFGNDKLTQAVASLPIHHGDLFQDALQYLPSHFNETFLASHLKADLFDHWQGEFSAQEIQAGVVLYINCLRVRLLQVNGFAEIVTRLAVLRTDRRTEEMQEDIKWLKSKLLEVTGKKDTTSAPFLHQLPPAPADFTGRETLIEDLLKDFEAHKGATISGLTGMGGIGKTALGLEVAHKLKEKYPDAQIFLDLKGTTEPLSAVDIARHVLLSFEPSADLRALDESNLQAVYQSVLHGKRAVLYFDNARSAEQIAKLIPPESCALLVTSRWSFVIAGLNVHKVGVLKENEAVDFLLELCPRIEDKANELARTCAYLPLALRIAGSFLRVNSNEKIESYLSKLNDRKTRLQALKQSRDDAEIIEAELKATFELSYAILEEDDRSRWRKLGVFPASFDGAAASVIWDLEEDATRKLLSLLRRYSLLDFDENSSRYALHDLLADYALLQIESNEERVARFRHASFYMAVMEYSDYLYTEGGSDLLQGLLVFDTEWTNIRWARQWAVANMSTLPEATSLSNYTMNIHCLDMRLQPQYILNWLEDSLRASRLLGDKRAEGVHLGNLGLVYSRLGMNQTAINLLEKAFELGTDLGDKVNSTGWVVNLGSTYLRMGEIRKAIELFDEALNILREIGDHRTEGSVLSNLGTAYHELGDFQKAVSLHEQGLRMARESGNRKSEGNALNSLGLDYAELGEFQKSIEFFKERLANAQEIGDKSGEGGALANLGMVYMNLGMNDKAIESYERALAVVREAGNIMAEGVILGDLGVAYFNLGESKKAIHFYKQAVIIGQETGYRIGLGNTLYNFGLALYKLGEKDNAVELVKQALEIYRMIESPNLKKAHETLKEWGALE